MSCEPARPRLPGFITESSVVAGSRVAALHWGKQACSELSKCQPCAIYTSKEKVARCCVYLALHHTPFFLQSTTVAKATLLAAQCAVSQALEYLIHVQLRQQCALPAQLASVVLLQLDE